MNSTENTFFFKFRQRCMEIAIEKTLNNKSFWCDFVEILWIKLILDNNSNNSINGSFHFRLCSCSRWKVQRYKQLQFGMQSNSQPMSITHVCVWLTHFEHVVMQFGTVAAFGVILFRFCFCCCFFLFSSTEWKIISMNLSICIIQSFNGLRVTFRCMFY